MIRWFLFSLILMSHLVAAVNLDQKEQRFLDSKTEIKIGAMDGWPPMNFVDYKNRPKGIGADLISALNQRMAGKLKIVSGPWKEIYEKATNGELDAILDITPKPEREQFFHFTDPYLRIPHVIAARKDVSTLQGLDSLAGKTVALEEGIGTVRYLQKNYPQINIREFRDTSQALDAVNRGEADAYVGNRAVVDYLIKQELLTHLKIHSRDTTRKGSVLAIGTHKSQPLLRDIFQKALDDIEQDELNDILSNWSKELTIDIGLTPEERAYLRSKKTLSFATASHSWPPFIFKDRHGHQLGLEVDFLQLLESRINLPVQVTYLPWAEVVERAKKHEFDAIFPASETPDRKPHLNFSNTYHLSPLALYGKNSRPKNETWQGFNGKSIAIVKGSSYAELVRKNRPDIAIVDTKNTAESLKMVAEDKVDATLDMLAVLKYHAKELGLNEKIKPSMFIYSENQGGSKYGIRNDEPLLSSIINKAIASYTPQEKNEINTRWQGATPDKQAPTGTALNEREKAWLQHNPTIRLAYMGYWPTDDEEQNVHTQFVLLLSKYGDLNINLVRFDTWKDGFAKAEKGEDVHGILNLSWSEEREKNYFDYTPAYYYTPAYIIVRQDNNSIKNLEDLRNKPLYLKQDAITGQIIKQLKYNIQPIELRSDESMYQRLSAPTRKADAMFSYTHDADKFTQYRLKVAKKVYNKFGEVHIGVSKKHPELHSILSKTFAKIPKDELSKIQNRTYTKTKKTQVNLTRKEKAFLRKHPTIILGADQNWQPFDFRDRYGKHAGFDAEYLDLLRKKLGIDIKVELGAWGDLQNKVKNKKLAGLVGPAKTPERDKYMAFTAPYFMLTETILVRKDRNTLKGLSELDGKTLALKKGSSNIEFIRSRYPGIKRKLYNTSGEVIRAVSLGEVEAGLTNVGAASYEMERNFISNIKVGYEVNELAGDMRFGIRKDWPELTSILQKGIDAITRDEINAILDRWLKLATPATLAMGGIHLTSEEKAWIKKHPLIKVSNELDWAPFDFAQEGKPTGLSIDYMKLIAQKTGLKLKFINGFTWSELVDQFKAKKIDVLHSLFKTNERETFANFTDPYYTNYVALALRKDSPIKNIRDLSGKKVALIEGFASSDYLLKANPNVIPYVVQNLKQSLMAVSFGEADAALESLGAMSYSLMEQTLTNLRIQSVEMGDFAKNNKLHIATHKDNPILRDILQKGIKAMTPEEHLAIRKRWILQTETPKPAVSLTPKEKSFLDAHPTIRVHNETDWPPFNFYEFGQPRGYSIDLMNLIAEKTGMNIEYITGPTWDEFLQMTQDKKLDIMLNIVKTPERSEYLNFTDPFLNAQHAIFVRKEDNSVKNFDDLLKNKKTIALVRGFYYHEYITRHHPEMKLLLVDSETESLQAVAYGKADATMGIMATLQYSMQKNYITNLKGFGDPSAKIFESIPLAMAARKDLPELISILQKGLAALTAKERRELSDNWLDKEDAEQAIDLKLTDEEKTWLAKHQEIRFTADPKYLPYEAFTKNGEYIGMVSEYLKLAEERLGITFKKIPTQSWTESLSLAKSGQVDVLSNYTVDESLKDIHLSTYSYIQSPISIIMQEESQNRVQSLGEYDNQKVAIIKGYGYLDEIIKKYPDLNYVEVDNAQQGLEGVSSGLYDAMLCSLILATYTIDELGLSNLEIVGQTGTDMELGLGVRKDWKIFVDIFNKAIQSITPGERRKIRQRWLGENGAGFDLDLTREEQIWLDKHRPIKYVYDVDWAPFEWKNELGEHTGIIYDILSLIEVRSGIEFEQVPTKKWSDAVNLMKNDKADMYSGVGMNDERKEYLNFTKNVIFETPYVFVLRNNDENDYLETFLAIKNKKVAVVDGYTIHGILKERKPNLPLLTVKSIQEGFEKVRNKELDIFIVNAATAKYFINRMGYDDLKIATKTEFNLKLKIALQKEMPSEALSIIDKAIATISEKDLSDIYFKWTEVVVKSDIDYTLILEIAGGVGFIFLIIVYWNRQLNRKVQTKTAELKLLLADFDHHVIASKTDLDGNITYASDAFCDISGYSREELIGYNHRKIKHPDNDPDIYDDLWHTIAIEKRIWQGEIKNRKKDGGYYWVDALIQPYYDLDGKHIGYSALRQDITAKKEVEALSLKQAEQMKEIERFNRIATGREGRIIELKEQVNAYCESNGEEPYYKNIETECELLVEQKRAENNREIKLTEVLDLEALQSLLDNFCNSVEIASAIIDLEGEILAASRWQRACTDFHRQNSASCANCVESDTGLALKLQEGQEFSIYQCKNGLVDCASPIIVEGQHVANVFIGQFLINKPDTDYFSNQAKQFGYDREAYLSAIDEVPVIDEKKLPDILGFLSGFAKMVTSLSFEKLKARENDAQNAKARMAALSLAEDAEEARNEVLKYQEHLEALVEERTKALEDTVEELQATQNAVEEQRQYLETVIDSQANIVLTTDGKQIKTANKAFLQFFNIENLRQFTDKHDCICDLFEQVEGKEYLQKFMGDQTWIEYVIAHPHEVHRATFNGAIMTVQAASAHLGKDLFFIAVFSDITQLEAAQEEIEKSRLQMELALDGGNMGSWNVDFLSNEMVVNERWATMLGYTYEEIQPSIRDTWINTLHPEEREKILSIGEDYRLGRTNQYEVEYRALTKEGEVRWFVSRGAAVEQDEEGLVTQMAGTVMDITERKKAEEQLRNFNQKITDSINYASLIQNALLPEPESLHLFFEDHFTIWQPKDVVGGDIFLYEPLRGEDEALMMVIDCTGHGVPGAFMTMLVKAVERSIVGDIQKGEKEVHPAEVLQIFNRTIRTLLRQDSPDAASNAGFDGGVLYFDKRRNLIRYAGAETPLFYFEAEGDLKIIKGDRQGIGYRTSDPDYAFTEHELDMEQVEGMTITTDGYIDQNGGEKGFPFGKKRLKKLLEENREEPGIELKEILLIELGNWEGNEERNDDVTIVGIRVCGSQRTEERNADGGQWVI